LTLGVWRSALDAPLSSIFFVSAIGYELEFSAAHFGCVEITHESTKTLRKTVISVYSNFAEGFERDGNREFAQFVSISKGSVGEARGQLLYAVDFGYLELEKFHELNSLGQRAGQAESLARDPLRILSGSAIARAKSRHR
jgi:four helix bundle protein